MIFKKSYIALFVIFFTLGFYSTKSSATDNSVIEIIVNSIDNKILANVLFNGNNPEHLFLEGKITDANNKVVYQGEMENSASQNVDTIDVTNFEKGTYTFVITDSKGKNYITTFSIN
jgi:protocatechuate 3,4-dioxygenase beta subunit